MYTKSPTWHKKESAANQSLFVLTTVKSGNAKCFVIQSEKIMES